MITSGNLIQQLAAVPDESERVGARRISAPLWDRQTSLPLNSAGLVIHGAGSALAKTGSSACYLLANGVTQKIAASTDMPALVGTVTNATFNVFCFFIDAAGTVTSQIGIAGTTLAKMKFPQFPQKKALIGFIIINPTGTGDFVGGTTALDDATVAPNAAYISPTCGFDPYALLGF
jgi:hypothetical protein